MPRSNVFGPIRKRGWRVQGELTPQGGRRFEDLRRRVEAVIKQSTSDAVTIEYAVRSVLDGEDVVQRIVAPETVKGESS
jgi:hypothetical protein